MPRRIPDQETAVLRALGSPIRQDILELLGRGPATSAMLGRALSSNTGVMSYHLRELGKARLIEPDEQRGRSHYWRLSREDIRFDDPQRSSQPALAKAVEDLMLAKFTASMHTYVGRTDLPDEWRDAALFSHSATAFTVAELAEFTQEYLALLKRWAGRTPTTKDARPVRIAFFAYPDAAALDERPTP